MRYLALVPLTAAALATACVDRGVTAPLRAPGSASFTVSPTPERTFVYVANTASGTVSVIQTRDNVVVATITVGTEPRGVAITPSGGRVYVSNRSSDNVSVIRTSDNSVIATIPVGHHPEDVVASPDGARVYVMNATDGSVSVVRTSDNTVVATFDAADAASAMAITPDGAELFVNTSVTTPGGPPIGPVTSYKTSVFRTSDYALRGAYQWALFRSPWDVAITPDGSRAYLPSSGGVNITSSLDVIQTSNLAEVASLSIGGFLAAVGNVSITPQGSYAYLIEPGLANFNGTCSPGGVRLIPTATNTLETTVPVSCFPNDVAFTPDGASAYVTNLDPNRAGNVTIISTSLKTVTGSVPVGSSPTGLAIGFVPTPADIMTELESLTSALDLSAGIKGSLLTKLNSALTAIEAGKTRPACGALQDFVSQVSAFSGKKISATDATLLIATANQLRELIGC
jgi:YVTN family beta-propeller protein